MEHRCPSADASCRADLLCQRCYGEALAVALRQADAAGQVWAESVCRGEYRSVEQWPEREPRTLEIARRRVAQLARDPRMLEPLAAACSAGAAAWWQRRPDRYRARR